MSSSCSSKRPRRRRRKIADAAAAATRDASSWASLHEDLVDLIAWRALTGDFRDYIRFRAVCSHWRSSTVCPRGRGVIDQRFHPRRWMLFPEGRGLHPGHGKLRGYVRFFNLSTGAFVLVRLPIFRDHCVLYSVDGILLLQRDHDTAVRLLHPFTGDIAEFPPLETLLPHVRYGLVGQDRWFFVRKISAAAISVGADGLVRLTMMLFLPDWAVSFATSGDQQWRVASWGFHDKIVQSPLSFQGKLYALILPRPPSVLGELEVMQIDPPRQEQEGVDDIGGSVLVLVPPPKLVAKFVWPTDMAVYRLVECNSEIMVISTGCLEVHFSVYRLADLMLGRTVPLTCLDGNTIFVGMSRLLCVNSKAFPTTVPDTIVVHDNNYYCGHKDYHLDSGTLSLAKDVITEGKHIPGPYSIMCHIFSCCYTTSWNKGKMLCWREWDKMDKWRVKSKWRNGA